MTVLGGRAAKATSALLVLVASTVWSGVPSAGATAEEAAAPAAAGPDGAAYVALQPCRLADTRVGLGAVRLDELTFAVSSRGQCAVPAEATSLALTLTAVDPHGGGFLTAWPADQARPTASNVNFAGGQIRANGSIVPVDAAGAFEVFTSVPTDVVVDVVGAFVPSAGSRSGRFVPVTPVRLFDSRPADKVGGGAAVTLPLPAGVPGDATALALNVTLTESSGAGFVTAFPAGTSRPEASILDVDGAGQTRAASGILPVSATGIELYLSAGGQLVVDLLGYFTGASADASTAGLFTAVPPSRALDTRGASTLGEGVPLYPGGGLELALAQGGSVAYNLTSVNGDRGYVTAFAAGTPVPPTSTVNSVGAGDVVANFAITQLSSRGLGLYSQVQSHVLVDVQGWFSGPTATATQPPPTNAPPPGPVTTYSACTSGGSLPLEELNGKRSAAGVPALAPNPAAERFACAYALQLAIADDGLVHSDETARDAAVGCTTGENIAYSSGTSIQRLLDLWFASPPHLANVRSRIYRSVGLGFVVRTDPDGRTTIFGVTDFATC